MRRDLYHFATQPSDRWPVDCRKPPAVRNAREWGILGQSSVPSYERELSCLLRRALLVKIVWFLFEVSIHLCNYDCLVYGWSWNVQKTWVRAESPVTVGIRRNQPNNAGYLSLLKGLTLSEQKRSFAKDQQHRKCVSYRNTERWCFYNLITHFILQIGLQSKLSCPILNTILQVSTSPQFAVRDCR